MGRHVCRELLLYLTPIRLLQENTNYYSSRMGRKIKDLPSLSHTLSKRHKKEFAKKTKIVREQNQNCSRTISKEFANSFRFVRELFFDCLSRIWKAPYYPSATGPEDSGPSAFFFSFFPFFSFFSLGATCSYVTSYIVTNKESSYCQRTLSLC